MNTPYYEFNTSIVASNYKTLKESLYVDKLFYALKPNSEKKILSSLNDINANFEVASEGELKKLVEFDIKSDRIICSLPIKSEPMIISLYKYGIRYFVFETFEEYMKLIKLAPKAKKILRIDINHIVSNGIEYGMNYDDFSELTSTKLINKDEIDGITFYIAKNKEVGIAVSVLNYCEKFLLALGNEKILNIGGNYRLPRELDDEYYKLLNQKLLNIKNKYKSILFAEPGRSVVKSAGKLFTRVVGVKTDKKYVYIDAGIPTGISYCPSLITNLNKITNGIVNEYSFFDNTCSHRILFKKEVPANIEIDDTLIFDDFGSYSICKYSNFHGWNKPKCIYKEELCI